MSAAATVACLALAVLLAFLALECLLGVGGGGELASQSEAPPLVVLMPAHNEEQGIAGPIKAVKAQLRPCDWLIVIADNCSDDTATIARALGATVIERSDPERRGKGYALEFARPCLSGSSSEVVIVVDADCIAQPGALARLAATTASRKAVVQGAYLMMPAFDGSAKVRISCFAFMVKNLVRQRALDRLSGAALLQGSGMGFPRAIFDRVEWQPASLVEDLDMGLDLLLAGIPVMFEGTATFLSDASSEAGTAGQRRRWEHGMLGSMGRYVPRLFAKALTGRWRLAFVGLDLMIPPTVILITAALLMLMVGLVVLGTTPAVWALLFALVLLGAGLSRAWQAHGREILPVRSLAEIPAYIWWKLPIAAQFFTQRERQWKRTERGP